MRLTGLKCRINTGLCRKMQSKYDVVSIENDKYFSLFIEFNADDFYLDY